MSPCPIRFCPMFVGLAVIAGALTTTACLSAEPEPAKPAQADVAKPSVDFATQIKPILERRCTSCHARGQNKGGLSINTRESVLAGGESGPSLKPGHAGESLLYQLVSGADPDRVMPEKGERLKPAEVALIKTWIDEGAAWQPGFAWKSSREAAVEPRHPALPAAEPGSDLTNPIDLLLQSHYKSNGVDPGKVVDDRIFVRRVYLDLIGLLPTPGQLDAFLSNSEPDKRAALVHSLLNQREDYATHWLTFWNDILRNEYRGTGFIDDGRRQITEWLFASLYDNKPFDLFVQELISPSGPEVEGFVKGIQWRGVVNASQRREVQAAQTISQVFLGANLKCASCHDSFIDDWKLADSWALASVFADDPLEMHRCDKATGEKANARFLFPKLVEQAKLTEIDPKAPRKDRMKQLAVLVTAPQNGRFARTIVNRLWSQLMGRGIVEPIDRMDSEPFNADLLDWLANDFVEHKHNLKHTLALICNSRAYQLAAAGEARPGEAAAPFRGPLVKRMTAEQFVDAISTLTGTWQTSTGDLKKTDGRGQGGQLAAVERVLAKRPDQKPNVEHIRASLAMSDRLTRALGRPNREQVVTRRESLATMLEGLEMTNGTALDHTIKSGAESRLKSSDKDPKSIVNGLFREALGRLPNDGELATAVELVGTPATVEGIQDLLWSIAMLPEFQLIY